MRFACPLHRDIPPQPQRTPAAFGGRAKTGKEIRYRLSLVACRAVLTRHCFVGAAYQNEVREQRLAAEISAATRERDFYLSRVDKAKGIAAIKERRTKQQEAAPRPSFAKRGASRAGSAGGETSAHVWPA